jgi:hypothetical protein
MEIRQLKLDRAQFDCNTVPLIAALVSGQGGDRGQINNIAA